MNYKDESVKTLIEELNKRDAQKAFLSGLIEIYTERSKGGDKTSQAKAEVYVEVIRDLTEVLR